MKQLYLLVIMLLFGSTALTAQKDFWREIDVLSHDFKPAPIPEKVLRREQRRIAPWIPVAGGVGVLGGLALIVNERDSLPTERPLAQDDTVRVTCVNDIVDVFPLRNDVGEGLRVAALQNFSGNIRIQNDSTVRFSIVVGQREQSVQVVVTNADGLSAISTITVILVNDVTITARPDTFAFQATTTLRANLLDNDTGSQLRLVSVVPIERDPDGRLDFNADGSIGFTSDIQGYGGVFTYRYTVRDGCENETSSTLTLLISQSACGFRYRIRRTDDICQGNTGQLRLEIANPENQTYRWSNGSTEPTATDLAAGDYSVTVTDQMNGCSEVLTANVPSGGGEVLTSVFTGNCGDASLTFRLGVQPFIDSFLVEITGQNVNFTPIALPRGEHTLSNLDSFLPPGNYVLKASYLRAPEVCASSATFTLQEVVPVPTMRVLGVTEFCEPVNGSATIVVNEDIGRPYKLERVGFEPTDIFTDTFTIELGPGNYDFVVTDRNCRSEILMVNIPICLWGGGEVGVASAGVSRPGSVEHPKKSISPFAGGGSVYIIAPLFKGATQFRGLFEAEKLGGAELRSRFGLALDVTKPYAIPELPASLLLRGGISIRTDGAGWQSGLVNYLEWRPGVRKDLYLSLNTFYPFESPWRSREISLGLRTPVYRR